MRGWSPLETGLAIFPGGLVVAIVAPRIGPLVGRVGLNRLIAAGLLSNTEIRTSRTGVWRLTVLHDRRIAVRTRVRVTRASVSLRHRAVLPDYAGADQVSVRAVAPSGESCTVGATLTASAPDRS